MVLRCALSCCALALLLACSGDSTLATGAGGGGGSTPTPCNEEPQCGDAQSGCIACAESSECVDELNACNKSTDCQSYAQCLQACSGGDDECVNVCENSFALGSAIYNNLFVCVFCGVCYSICDGATQGCTI
jgi:hypothetical protein